jgi:chitinase
VQSKRVVCYYTNWAQYRQAEGKFFPENIDPNLCTHVIYSFATMTASQLDSFEWNDKSTDWSKGMYERTTDLKKVNPSLKVMLAVGGLYLGSGPFSDMVTDQALRQKFVNTSVDYLTLHNFDGLDLV